MVLVIAGIAITAFAIHHWRQISVPSSARRVTGVVTEVAVESSSLVARSRPLYRPTVEYVHPGTGQPARLESEASVQTEYTVGDRVEVACDPSNGRAVLVTSHRFLKGAVFVLFGLAVVALGVVDLAT